MVSEESLTAVLSEFARTMATDFPIQGILDHLVDRIVQVLPVTAAGVTLIAPETAPRYVAASDESALRFEQLQTEIGEGPCLTAYHSGTAVAVPDLSRDDRHPMFAPAALAAGLAAVFTFPLRHGDGRLGALDLYRDTAGPLSAAELVAAQTLADVAAAYLLNAQARKEARDTSDRFRHSSLHDPLTGLPNRVLFLQRLEHAANRARRSHACAAVLFVDLDRFKRVNDTHGHQAGDELLQAVAVRLSGMIRPGDTLARFAGDEFVVLCEDLTAAADGELLAARMGEAFAIPFQLAGMDMTVSASVGMAYAGPGEDITTKLITDADIAMYQAKRRGDGRHQIIDLREAHRTSYLHSVEEDLRRAFCREELGVAYQPIVRSADGRITGVEALLRWTHPKRGPVPPLVMVGVAEQSGLIGAIGAWVLERGCRDRATWLRAAPEQPLDLAVNVSARQLTAAGFVPAVGAILAETGMDPAALILEMTEGIFLADGPRTITVLNELRALGVRIALDDFGTGYSSLSYLRQFPVDIVKIDRGFTADIGRHPAGAAIIAAVTSLAHALGISVTVEGVETPEQRDQILPMGCEFLQGFFYAQPMPAAAVGSQLARRTR